VGRKYGPISKFKNKPLTKLSGSYYEEKWSKTTTKQVFKLLFSMLGPFGHPKNDPKRYSKVRMWVGPMAQYVSLKISH
jgi:hypothetical protein